MMAFASIYKSEESKCLVSLLKEGEEGVLFD